MDPLHTGPSLSALLHSALARHPERTAFVWDGGQISYRGTAELIGRMQAVYAAAGLGRGTRVALLAANQVEAWCAGMAAQASGMVTTWLHQLGSLDDHLFQLRDFGAQVLVLDAAGFADRSAALADGHGAGGVLQQVYTLGPAGFGRDLVAAAHAIGHHGYTDLSRADDLATVNYTGGTTGRSKGAMRRQAGYAAMINAVAQDFELPERPHYLAAAPMTHVAGTLVQPTLMRGGTVRLMSGFHPGRWLHTVAAEGINTSLLVPTMVYTLLDQPELDRTDLRSLQSLIYGASPMSPTRLLEGLQRIGPVFAQLYGQTEGYPISFLPRSAHDAARPELFASCGVATSCTTLALLDDDDQPVAPGAVGELCVRGPQVMDGYLNQPELTAATLRNGWLHTGDMGHADAQGHCFLVDRKKDMIISGGFNVYPRDVEDVISSHPAVAMVAVIGVPDAKWGEAVTAVVQLKPGQVVDTDALGHDLAALVRQKKGSVHAPKQVHFTDAMPRTAVGKIDKKVLRAPFWAGQTRNVG
jgi:fatty-acyl-CoA synthase